MTPSQKRRTGFWGRVVALLLLTGIFAPLSAQQLLFYAEREKDGRVYVFNTPEKLKLWEASGEMGTAVTLPGAGANGETVVAENETAVDLYNFKHNLPGYDRPTAAKPAGPTYPAVKVGGLGYLSFQDGKSSGAQFDRFTIKRGYINVTAQINSFLSARFTPDVTIDSSTGNALLRYKYAYGAFQAPALGFLTRPVVEFGLVHTPWLDFEEGIDNYRMQDSMAMERNGLFSSADFGVMFGAQLGGELSDEYQKAVSKKNAGKFGSFMVGVYNGGGYNAVENNKDKTVQARLTIRPAPSALPGLQLSYLGMVGKGNTAKEPDFNVNAFMASYEHSMMTITAQYFAAKGKVSGSAVSSSGTALEERGYSVFVEAKVRPQWSGIVRYDHFDPNRLTSNDENNRTIFGVAYKIVGANILLVDYDRVSYKKPNTPDDTRFQTTLQVSF